VRHANTRIPDPAATIAGVLEGYANRGVFRGYSRSGNAFRMLWHRDRSFDLKLDVSRKTLRMPAVLPQVSPSMFTELKAFVESRFSAAVPSHRRIERRKVRAICARRGGDVSITMTVVGRDFEYAARRLIHLVHEIYLVFLNDGRYFDYMVETLKLDPDRF
jgi:hypothetical protein